MSRIRAGRWSISVCRNYLCRSDASNSKNTHNGSNRRKYDAVEAMSRRALEGYEKVLEKEHLSTLTSVHNLTYLLSQLRRHDEALLLYKRASSGYRKSLGLGHLTIQACLSNQAAFQHQLDAEAVDDATQEVTEGSPHPSPHHSHCLSLHRILDANHSEPEPMRKDPWWRKFRKKSGKR